MANRKKTHEFCRLSKNSKRHIINEIFSSSSSDEEATTNCRRYRNSPPELVRNRTEMEQGTGLDVSRRESNPLSFKVFLKNGTQTNYHNTGARPKIYSSPTSSPGCLEKDTVYSRNPTELPDFVQDHLVIEQCYLNHESTQQVSPDVDNLPDFALNSMEQRQSRIRNETMKNESNVLCDLPFDLTGTLDKGLQNRDHSVSNVTHSNNLTLPTFERPVAESLHRLEPTGFPFDLPLPMPESNPDMNAAVRDCPSGSETNIHKSLPDFLNDGPIHNRTALSTDPEPTPSMVESTDRRLLLENERLRRELEMAQRQIREKSDRIRFLESKLLCKREATHEETVHLEKAMEHVENNLKQSTKRATNAESTVTSLKKEIKALTTEISLLRLENNDLRTGITAAEQRESNITAINMNRTVKRLAHDLFTAASTAEVSLKQLMSGVDNLRVLASTLNNADRIEDWTKDFLPDFDEDNAAGPAV